MPKGTTYTHYLAYIREIALDQAFDYVESLTDMIDPESMKAPSFMMVLIGVVQYAPHLQPKDNPLRQIRDATSSKFHPVDGTTTLPTTPHSRFLRLQQAHKQHPVLFDTSSSRMILFQFTHLAKTIYHGP